MFTWKEYRHEEKIFMKYAVFAPATHDYAEPGIMVDLARSAEEAGWDGFFIADHIMLDPDGNLPLADPTVVLSAIAAVTEKIKLGPMVTPVSRRRPWKLAKELATLDRLSNGRVIFGVGLGGMEQEFANFGENPDKKYLAKRTDEGLEIIERLHKGEPVNFHSDIYRLTNARFLPRPVQQPRIPVWVASMLPAKAGQRRSARWDGVMPHNLPADLEQTQDASELDWVKEMSPSPSSIREVAEFVSGLREEKNAPFDVIASGSTSGMESESVSKLLEAYRQAGATWWLEWIDENWPVAKLRHFIMNGPPGN